MPLTRIKASMLENDDRFSSFSAAELANLGSLGTDIIEVIEAGEIVRYSMVNSGGDLSGADFSEWRRGTLTRADMIAAITDAVELTATITRGSGDWTPTLSFSGGGGAFTYGVNRVGTFKHIDGIVQVDCAVTATVDELGLGNLRLSGIPEIIRPMAGVIPGYLQMPVKGAGFFLPYGASEINVSWTPGSAFGAFNYYGSSGQISQPVTTMSSYPGTGGSQLVTWPGGRGNIEDWRPTLADTTVGRLILINVIGDFPANGATLTGDTWTAVADNTGRWQGAPVGETFLTANNLVVGMELGFVLSGQWRIA